MIVKKIIHRFLGVLLTLTIVLLILFAFLYGALQTSFVQTKLSQYFASQISESVQLDITIDKVTVGFWSFLILEDVSMIDKNHDTLAQVNEVWARIDLLELSTSKFVFSEVIVKGAEINIITDSLGETNINALSHLFSESDTVKAPFLINLGRVTVENSRFRYRDFFDCEVVISHQLNFTDVDVHNVNFAATGFQVDGNGLMFDIEDLRLVEKCGLTVKKLSTQAYIDSKNLSFNNIAVLTKNSDIAINYLNFSFNSTNDFSDIFNRIHIKSDIANTQLGFDDIAYFAEELIGFDVSVQVSGLVEGTISNFKGKGMEIYYGDSTFFRGDVEVVGLPEITETFWHIDVKRFTSSVSDFESFPQYPFTQNKNLTIPDVFHKFHKISYSGKFSGYPTDFVTYGTFNTDLGKFSTDLSLKIDSTFSKYFADGFLKVESLNASKLLSDSNLGIVSGQMNLNGTIHDDGFARALLKSNFTRFDYNGYSYKNIAIDGEFEGRKYNGFLSVNDPNLKMQFNGAFDFTQRIPHFDFAMNVEHAQLFNLKLVAVDTVAQISTTMNAKFAGNSIDEIVGNVTLLSTKVHNRHGSFEQDSILLDVTQKNDVKKITLSSNALDLEMTGRFILKTAVQDIINFGSYYVPSLYSNIDTSWSIDYVDFKFNIKEIDSIFKKLYPDLSIANNTKGQGQFSPKNSVLSFVFSSKHLQYKNIAFDNVDVGVTSNKSFLNAAFQYDIPFEARTIKNINIGIYAHSDSIAVSGEWMNKDSVEYSGNFDAEFILQKQKNRVLPRVNAFFNPAKITLADSIWKIDSFSAFIDTSSIAINNMIINKSNQKIYVEGKISELPSDSLSVAFNNFDMHNLNQYVDSTTFNIAGLLNGTVKITDVFSNILLHCSLNADKVYINGKKMGQVVVQSKWNSDQKFLELSIDVVKGIVTTFHAIGTYYPYTQDVSVQASVNMLEISFLQLILDGILSDINGYGSGNVSIGGKITKPEIIGNISLHKTSVTVDVLQSKYLVSGTLTFVDNHLLFNSLSVLDKNANSATFSGDIDLHDVFNPIYDFSVKTDKILTLNTTAKNSDVFYGSVYASGLVRIFGDMDITNIKIAARTEENTYLVIPYTDDSDVAEINFITFINTKLPNKEDEKPKNERLNFQGVEVEIDVEVTPDAEIQIVMDETAGGNITAHGNGNVKLFVDKNENLTMSGVYEIETGDYLFSLRNLINKRFSIESGSTITWTGDPFNADINLNALYKLKTSLKPIMSLYDTTSTYNARVAVDCKLKMTNSLMFPEIEFDIEIHDTDEKPREVLQSLDIDEKNKQFLSLLVLNSFMQIESATQTQKNNSSAYYVTSTEMLSNQLSHWLSQISNDFDMGVNYRPGDAITGNELEVALSTQILNDRVIVNVNGATEFGRTQTTTENNSKKIAGDVSVEVKLNKRGNIRLKGFSRSNNDPYDRNQDGGTQGVGVFYTEDFNTLGDLFRAKTDADKRTLMEPQTTKTVQDTLLK